MAHKKPRGQGNTGWMERLIANFSVADYQSAMAGRGGVKIEWDDANGRKWSPLGRLGYLWWTGENLPVNRDLGAHLLKEAMANKTAWQKSAGTPDFVWLWLGQLRQPEKHTLITSIMNSEAGANDPSIMTGLEQDGGWLNHAMTVIEEECKGAVLTTSRAEVLTGVARDWMMGPVLGLEEPNSRDWRSFLPIPDLFPPVETWERMRALQRSLEPYLPLSDTSSTLSQDAWARSATAFFLKPKIVIDATFRPKLWAEGEFAAGAAIRRGNALPWALLDLLKDLFSVDGSVPEGCVFLRKHPEILRGGAPALAAYIEEMRLNEKILAGTKNDRVRL
jgi:hypothetical protein